MCGYHDGQHVQAVEVGHLLGRLMIVVNVCIADEVICAYAKLKCSFHFSNAAVCSQLSALSSRGEFTDTRCVRRIFVVGNLSVCCWEIHSL